MALNDAVLYDPTSGDWLIADTDLQRLYHSADGVNFAAEPEPLPATDEIGELTPELQASLLGVLERGRFRRLGGQHEIPVDVRAVCATHRDLRAEVNAKQFRLDLFYRLAVVQLSLPALRERRDDIPMLVKHFLSEEAPDADAAALFPPQVMDRLEQHSWPGNVATLCSAPWR